MLEIPINATCYNSEDLAKIINLVWMDFWGGGGNPGGPRPWGCFFRYWDLGPKARAASEEVHLHRADFGTDPLVKYFRYGPAYCRKALAKASPEARSLVNSKDHELGLGCMVGIVKPRSANFPDASPLELLSSLPSGLAPACLVDQIAFRVFAARQVYAYGHAPAHTNTSTRRKLREAIEAAGLELRFDLKGARPTQEHLAERASISVALARAAQKQVAMDRCTRHEGDYERRLDHTVQSLRSTRKQRRGHRTERNEHRREAERILGTVEARKGGTK